MYNLRAWELRCATGMGIRAADWYGIDIEERTFMVASVMLPELMGSIAMESRRLEGQLRRGR